MHNVIGPISPIGVVLVPMKLRYSKPAEESEVSLVAYSVNFETMSAVLHLSDGKNVLVEQSEVDRVLKKGKLLALLAQLACEKLGGSVSE